MIHNIIRLSDDDDNVTLTTYLSATQKAKSDGILIIPGGGYNMVCNDREGEPIAMAFAALGYRCFVLHYSLNEQALYPRPLLDASLAMAHIAEHAEEYGVDPKRIFVCGFSAGGHLAGALGCRWHTDEVNQAIQIPFGSNRPAGMMLCYPVISTCQDIKESSTFRRVLGTETPTQQQIQFCSLENGLEERTAPAFFLHTANDEIVHVRNTLRMATALSEANVPFEMHIFPNGCHGQALGTQVTADEPQMLNDRLSGWIALADSWMQKEIK